MRSRAPSLAILAAAAALVVVAGGCGPEVIEGQRPTAPQPVVCLGAVGELGWRPIAEADPERADVSWYRTVGTVVDEAGLPFTVTWNVWDCNAAQRRPGVTATLRTDGGEYWRVGFGLRDFETLADRTPRLDLSPGAVLELAAAEGEPGDRGLLLQDGRGPILAAEERTGELLGPELSGLTVGRGEPDGPVYEDQCGRTRPTPVLFEGEETVSVAPGDTGSVGVDGTMLEAYAGPAYEVIEARCTDMASALPYAVYR